MKKLRDLLRLKFDSKLTHRQIAGALNISPGTVSHYSQAAVSLGLSWPLPEGLDDDALSKLIEPIAKQLRNQALNKVMPEFELVQKELSRKHMTLVLIWEDYVKANSKKAYSYSQFTRHYKKWCKKSNLSMRLEHVAGENAFIDYAGTTIPIYCRQTKKVLFKAQIFIMALCFSQYTFAYASRSQKLPDWIDAHVRAFRFFDGVPEILVPDNLKSGITNSCKFEPEANPTYADMAEYYNTVIIPARPITPQDKSIGENAVLLASRWILARLLKQTFYGLNTLNNAIANLLEPLNKKPFQKRQGSRHEQFITLEKLALRPLPKTDYVLATLRYQTVSKDYHVYLENHYYSVPYTYVTEKVLCRYTQNIVEIFNNNCRIASHQRSFDKDKKTTLKEHMPKAHQLYQGWTPQVFIDWAKRIGPGVLNVANEITASNRHPQQCSKIHFGLKNLYKRFGKDRLNKACRRAIILNCIQFKSIQSILEKGLDKTVLLEVVHAEETKPHENLRGANYYK